MLGFRGHFSSKSRRYSIPLGRLRRARVRFQRLRPTPSATGRRWTSPTSRRGSSQRTTRRPSSSAPGPTWAPGGPTQATRHWPTRPQHAPASTRSGRHRREPANDWGCASLNRAESRSRPQREGLPDPARLERAATLSTLRAGRAVTG
ncbi:replication initiator [Cellulosimicrobium sp. Marseille-Q4280]|uniref:replication initiator n=1 Tax=Cellulosimicrobium sp. Marseille-Q4280 TaxID=2937992 RepID=UPI00333AAF77